MGASLQVSPREKTKASSKASRAEPGGGARAGAGDSAGLPATTKPTIGTDHKDRQTWLDVVEELVREVESWAKRRHWAVRRDSKKVRESRLGDYTVPVLSILAPSGQVHLDPVGRHVAGGDGRVDLLAWPSLTRMLLIRSGDTWLLKTDSGVTWPEGWSQQSFERLVEALNAAA